MPRSKSSRTPARDPEQIVYTTSEGRQDFPDLVQKSYGEKSILGFNRYGRFLGALVPPEAVMLLADEQVDDATRKRIRAFASKLMTELNQRPTPMEFVDLDESDDDTDGTDGDRRGAVTDSKAVNKSAA
jgi:hypothetical protein